MEHLVIGEWRHALQSARQDRSHQARGKVGKVQSPQIPCGCPAPGDSAEHEARGDSAEEEAKKVIMFLMFVAGFILGFLICAVMCVDMLKKKGLFDQDGKIVSGVPNESKAQG